MTDSILDDVKKVVNIEAADTSFDVEIIMHINSILGDLLQMGVGPETAFSITDSSQTWADFLTTNTDLNSVKSYVALSVRLIFDPPAHSYTLEALKDQCAKFEWRLSTTAKANVYKLLEEGGT